MREQDREDLCMKSAGRVHAAWCEGELKGFYGRLIAEKEEAERNGESVYDSLPSLTALLTKACRKGGKVRNEITIEQDPYFLRHEPSKLFSSFETFKKVVESELTIRRFTGRNLTQEEIERAGEENYKSATGEENILRPFEELSADSQKENLEAAKGAAVVLEEYLKRGYTIEQLLSKDLETEIGTLIHADWMERNKRTENNRHLFVKFNELDDWTRQQDLDVFFAMVEEYVQDQQKYEVPREEGLEEINAEEREKAVLDALKEKERVA